MGKGRSGLIWANNNYDRTPYDADDSAFYDDDVATNDPTWSPSPGTPGVSTPDWNYQAADGTQIISNLRDLQDYFRLWIPGLSNMVANLPTNYTVTLQWRNNTGAAVRIFKAAETNGGTNYQFNQSVGTLQLLWDSYPCYGFVSPSQTISLDQAFASTTVPKPSDYFIFCGSAVGNDELVCQVRNPYGGVVGEASVFLNIKDIKQMYERWSVGEYPSLPSNTATNCGDDGSPSFQYPYDPSIDSATPYILFVHGWNMQTWEKDRFAESAFKRLYWQGYQGRFGVFRWPTENGFTGTLIQFATTPSEKDNYDRSEYTAWQSATGLLNQLAFLNNRYPGQTYMLAHSMGNIVAGEALRLAGTTNVVNTYVASQAAISAHTYDPTITNYSFSDSPWILIANTPNIYGNWFATNNGRGAGEIISFYNVNDYALQRSAWQLNQLLKPDQFVLENGTHWDYSYNGLTNDPAPWNHFEKAVSLGFTVIDFDIVNVLTNRYEVMGLAAESYTTALGATPNVQNIRRNVDLSQLWPSDSVHPTHPFDEHFYHSAQFRGDYWQQQNYWSELLGADAFNLKP
jgi:pimeloyl-ACP methyl ester carboxylesterase